MGLQTLGTVAVVLVTITSLALLIIENWRTSILLLAIQYVGVMVLVAINWPIQMAVTKLVAGWIAGAVLGIAILSNPHIQNTLQPSPTKEGNTTTAPKYKSRAHAGRLFRVFSGILMIMAVYFLSLQIPGLVSEITPQIAYGGLIIVGLALLKLGLTDQTFFSLIGLLCFMAGFEIIYAAMEQSALVAGLLAGINLSISLVGAYLILSPVMEEGE